MANGRWGKSVMKKSVLNQKPPTDGCDRMQLVTVAHSLNDLPANTILLSEL